VAGTVAAGDGGDRSTGLSLRGGTWNRLKRFYWKAYEDNLTGLSAMVAYNMLLSLLPVTLLALFVAGQVLQSENVERSVLEDLRDLFPDTAESTLTDLLRGLQDFSTSLGIAALIASIWIGTSFWGALDTAFCRIYHVRSAEELPFGLSDVPGLLFGVTLAVGLLLLFATLCAIYWAVPNTVVPWRAIWPGAALATLAIAIVDFAFPFYLSQISTIERVGTTLVFLVIVLLWFYVLAIVMLGGAVINALRMQGESRGTTGADGGWSLGGGAGLPPAPPASSSGS
jgi:membrane protein